MDISVDGRFEVLHSAVPGRLRLSIPELKYNDSLAVRLAQRLQARPLVASAGASAATGNVTITFKQPIDSLNAAWIIEQAMTDQSSEEAAWWGDATEIVLTKFATGAEGLSTSEIIARQKYYGRNVLSTAPSDSQWDILLRQFNSLPVWLLGTSAVLSLASGGLVDAALISGVIAANAAMGFFTERRAERILQSFITHDQTHVMVRRDSIVGEVAAEELVPGDIILLLAGSVIAADARIISSLDLHIDESMLTGESVAVSKSSIAVSVSASLADRTCMLYAGTLVVSGSAVAMVVAIGDATEAGHIQALVNTTEARETPIQRQLTQLGTHLTIASLAASGLLFGLGFLRGVPLATLLKTTIALAVAAIPEGLPSVATSILATGLQKMQRHNVLIRQLSAVETLGAVNVICFDKTGTLTQNRMTVRELRTSSDAFVFRDGVFYRDESEISPVAHDALLDLLRVCGLCNDSEVQAASDTKHVLNGSSTENALLVAAMAGGLDLAAERLRFPIVDRVARRDDRRYMITIHENGDTVFVAAKGNPVDLLALCESMRTVDGIVPLSADERLRILHHNETMARRGLRVLGFACAELHQFEEMSVLIWLGLIGMADPVRPGIDKVLQEFRDAGIHSVMVTGDQPGTAAAIAQEVKLAPIIRLCPFQRLQAFSPEERAQQVPHYDVFARVSPAHKLDIVQDMQRAGLTVAMTGDGTNDAPALRAADIGVALGRHGTDAARGIADVVLAEDDLQTMVVAVREGRTIYANMRKAIHFLVSTNSSEVMVTLGAAACGLGQPLNPGQLLWLNLVTDVAIAYSLGLEPMEYDVMQRPPRPRDENILRPQDYSRLALKSGLFSISALATHLYGMARYGATGGGIAFSTLIGAQLLDGLSSRSETQAPWSLPPNHALTASVVGTAAVQGLVSVLPWTRNLLGLATFDLLDVGVIVAGALWPFLVVETVIKPHGPPPPSQLTWD